MLACLSVRAELSKSNSSRCTWQNTKSVSCPKNMAKKSSTPVQRKTRFICTCITTTMTSSLRCLDFSRAFTFATCVRRLTSIRRSIDMRMRASVVDFRPSAPKCPGERVKIVTNCSRASSVLNSINRREAMPDLCASA